MNGLDRRVKDWKKKMNRLIRRAQVEDDERWEYWRGKIPAIIFPSHWQVRVIPPWANVIARFWVDPVGIKPLSEAPIVCVYLDVNNSQGYYPGESFGKNPYWEMTSLVTEDGDPFRCGMNEIDKLIDNINGTLEVFWMELKKENRNQSKLFIDGNRCVSYGNMQIKIQPEYYNLIDDPETLDQIYIDEELCKNIEIYDDPMSIDDELNKRLDEKEFDYGESPDPEKVKERLKEYNAEWTSEGWIVSGNLNLWDLELTKLPLIKSVNGYFDCNSNQLTSLKGSPKEVGGNFYCHNNQLISLEGCPQKVGGGFNCNINQLTTLEGIGKVGGRIYSDFDDELVDADMEDEKAGGWVKISDPITFNSSCYYESVNQKSEDIGKKDFCISICAKDGEITSTEFEKLEELNGSNDWINFISDGKKFEPVSIDLEVPRKRLNIAKLSECTLVKDKGFMELQDNEGKRVDLFIREVDGNGKSIPIVIGDPKNDD